MAYMDDYVRDSGLSAAATAADTMHITSQEVTVEANISTYTLGNKGSLTISAAQDHSPNGREIEVSSFTGGSVTGTGTASHWALVDTGNRVIAAGALGASQSVTSGNTFSFSTATTISIADAA